MELTVREVAALTGRSPRTVRAQVARGELPGVKRNGSWRISRNAVPLTEAQRQALRSRADDIRKVVDDILPSRLATTRDRRPRSLVDLDAFRLGATLLKDVASARSEILPEGVHAGIVDLLEQALLDLAESAHQFDRQLKLAAINRARGALARSLATILIRGENPPHAPALDWIAALENEILPAVGGLARWTERLGRGRP